MKGALNEPSRVCARDSCYGRSLCCGYVVGDPMTNDDKKRLGRLLQERIDDCKKEMLEAGETCRIDCSHYENCLEHAVFFDIVEELGEDALFEEDMNA